MTSTKAAANNFIDAMLAADPNLRIAIVPLDQMSLSMVEIILLVKMQIL